MVQNTYRVLLTRGMKGCYVTFMDKNTEHFFRSRMEFTGRYLNSFGVVTTRHTVGEAM